MKPLSTVGRAAIARSSPTCQACALWFSLGWHLAKNQLHQRLLSLPVSHPILYLPIIALTSRTSSTPNHLSTLQVRLSFCSTPQARSVYSHGELSQWVLQVPARASSGIGSYSGIWYLTRCSGIREGPSDTRFAPCDQPRVKHPRRL